MVIKSLSLKNFRNYENLDLVPSPGLNVLYGDNGQGKTNIIESIYMCACARSHRTAKDAELIRHDKLNYKIDLEYYSSVDKEIDYTFLKHLGIYYGKVNSNDVNKRVLYKNKTKLDKLSDFVGNFNAVIFAPEDLQIVKDGPGARRRFLDLLLSQIKPSYFVNLQNYSKILNQRNNLLKKFRDEEKFKLNQLDTIQLETWDEQLATVAIRIISERLQIIERMKHECRDIHKYISENSECLSFKYKSNSGIDIFMSEAEMKKAFMNKLNNKRFNDIGNGSTSVGPHREDFEILLNEYPIRVYGSQGQQRTAVLSLKITELEIIKKVTNEMPILLLDDVMSELDKNRREKLLEILGKTQIFLTVTEPNQLDEKWIDNSEEKGISYYKVDAGRVYEVSK